MDIGRMGFIRLIYFNVKINRKLLFNQAYKLDFALGCLHYILDSPP